MRPQFLTGLILAQLLLACPLWAQVTVVESADASDNTGVDGVVATASVTGSAGDILLIGTTWRQNAAQTVVTPTYNGSATGVTLSNEGCQSGRCGALHYLVSPGGSGVVSCSVSAATPAINCTAIVVDDVDTATPIADSDEQVFSGATVTPDLTLSSAAGGIVIDLLTKSTPVETLTVGADQTEITAEDSASVQQQRTSSQAGAASVTMTWSWTTTAAGYQAAIALTEDTGGGAPPANRRSNCLVMRVCE